VTAVLEGLGTAVPPRVVTNDELTGLADTTSTWIRERTGITSRRWAEAETSTGDLAVEAGARALKSAGHPPIDMVVLATTTPDHVIPSTAPVVAARLGLGHVAAVDLNAACSGFVYGLAVASSLVTAGTAERVLLVGADTMTRVVDPTDRDTAVLFGDGAGAAVLGPGAPGQPGAVGPFDLGSDGDAAELLRVDAGGARRPADAGSVAERAHYLRMDGREVYRRAVLGMTRSCEALLGRAGLPVEAVDHLVGHQANARILRAVASRIGIPDERCVVNIDRLGNTSAGSIPLALGDTVARPGDRLLLTAFGAGLTWGSVLLTWPDDLPGRPA
jgi:3-oxoacyl-[acyl-carrier-protein] synthase III